METYGITNNTTCGILIGLFSDRESTENVYNATRDLGYRHSDIWLIMTEETRDKNFSGEINPFDKEREKERKPSAAEINTHIMQDDLTGILEVIKRSLVLAKPGIIVTGALAMELTRSSKEPKRLEEVLIKLGIPEERIKSYELGILEGKVLMAIVPKNEEDSEYLEKNWKGNYVEEALNLKND